MATTQFDLHAGANQMWLDTRWPYWDGGDAVPVPFESYEQVRRLIDVLPPSIDPPTFSADQEGMMVVEWYRGPRKRLLVTFPPEDGLHYEMLLGEISTAGHVEFTGEGVPEVLLELASKVTNSL